MIPINNGIYRHFKGSLYRVIATAVHSETGEKLVVYQGLYDDFPVYCRPYDMFVSEVDHEKYPDCKQKYRFEPVSGLVSADACVTFSEDALSEPVNTKKDEREGTEEEDLPDPLILEFLDAETNLQKRNILKGLHHRITNEMIDTLAAAMDIVIEDGDLQDRYRQLESCLATIDRYEIERK